MTAKRMISGDVLKYRNGFLIRRGYETRLSGSSEFCLTVPFREVRGLNPGNRATTAEPTYGYGFPAK